jgi:site-specific DNA-methyltransferase (adenine-specific)
MPEPVKIGDATLYLGDCLAILPTLGKVDAVVTDPPCSKNTHKMAKTNKGKGHGNKLVTFSALSGQMFDRVVECCLSISGGWVVMTCDYKHAARYYEKPAFIRLGAWVKSNPMPQISADRPGQGFETVLILHSGKSPKKWNRGGGAGVWLQPVATGAQVPTQKPLPLVSAFIKDFTQPAQSVADPFMGSGTTGVACAKLGRKFVGCEIDPGRFSVACERIQKAYDEPDLFVAPPDRPTQGGLDL